LNHLTARKYLSYLETVYLTNRVPAWPTNLTSKVAKTPKLYLTDPGLAAHLLGVDTGALSQIGHPALGPIIETLVQAKLVRLLAASEDDFRHLRWLRDHLGSRFAAGVVLYLGDSTHSFGDRLIAAPVSSLWGHARLPDQPSESTQ
jgi:uncharacterized protein